jgi:hypothetical protein
MKEKIGNPDLFTGRKKEMNDLLIWVEKTKNEWPLGIRDRSATEADAFHGMVQLFDNTGWYLSKWEYAKFPKVWMHCPGWTPRTYENILNEAIEIMNKNPALLSEYSVKTVQEALDIAKRSLKTA